MRTTRRIFRAMTVALVGIAIHATGGDAQAQSVFWVSQAIDFNAGVSWQGGVAPGPTNIATFQTNQFTTGNQPSLTASTTVLGLNFSNGGYILSPASSGLALTLASNGTGTSSAVSATAQALSFGQNATVNVPIILSGTTPSIAVTPVAGYSAEGTLAFNAPISSSGNTTLTFSGAGKIALNAANTYSGVTTGSGRVVVGNKAAFGTSTLVTNGNSLILSSPETVDLRGANKVMNPITVNGGSILMDGNGLLEFGGNVAMSGAASLNSQTNASNSTFTATTFGETIFSGVISGSTDLRLNVSSDGHISLTGANTISGNALLTGIGAVWVSSIGNSGSAGALGAGSSISIAGGRLVYIGAGDSSNRAITIDASGGRIDSSGTGALSLTASALTLSSPGSLNIPFTLGGTQTGANTFAGAITGNVNFMKEGTGTWVLAGANTFTGNTTVNSGTLKLSGPGKLGTNELAINGGTLDLNSTSQNVGVVRFARGNLISTGGGGSLTATRYDFIDFNGGGTSIVSAILAGTANLLVSQESVTLSALNTFSGSVRVIDMLSINSIANVGGGASALGAPTTVTNGTVTLGTGDLTGTLRYTGPAASTDRVISLGVPGTGSGGGVIDASGTGPLNFTSALAMTSTGNRSLTLSGSATGNSFDGIIGNGSGIIALVKNGTGSWNLSGSNSYSGGTTINGGTLALTGSGTLGAASGPLSLSGGTLDLNGHSSGVGQLSGSGGTIANNASSTAATFTVGGGNANGGNFSGTLADHTTGTGTLALLKIGTGLQTLSHANTFSGGTTINGGTLALNANQALGSGAVTVGSAGHLSLLGSSTINNPVAVNGRLSGTGTIHALVTVNSGGTVAPGNSIGTLTVDSFTWSGNSLMAFELGAANVSDRLSIAGALTRDAGSNITFDFLTGGAANSVYTLVTFGSLAGLTPGDVSAFSYTNLASGVTSGYFTLTSDTLYFNTGGASGIPEPSTYALLAGGAVLAVVAWKRRRA